ncbi:Membrane-bound inhibitor of C-type lysozyme [Aeromonas sp. RU39B]|mgnify:CR=1 FL=1|uniref:MliC family protein n=1 Tax=Aeromonas sp. RU39B TaxID=1907416 RepID=UPI000956E889|nr:MliC family protein [Aeromonas sp. RU39B]SIQ59740.1 Membrane-bound inhibitor of C-type lysozyme [Aeromonas sp. RU39B]
MKAVALLFPLLSLLLTACHPADSLSVKGGDPVQYQCEGGETITVRYFSLTDDSLNFIKLTLPENQQVTLPQVVSGSGARYSDGHDWSWWSKGQGGFVEQPDDSGEWQTAFGACQQQ